MPRRSVVNLLCLGTRAVSLLNGNFLQTFHSSLKHASSLPKAGFKPEKVAVVTKTTRYEFEQQRYLYAGLSEEDLKHLGSSYSGLQERHKIHTNNVEHIVKSLRSEGIEVRIVKRGEYDEEVVLSKDKPVVGVNTDPERSEGHLCLPVRYTHAFPEALKKLCCGEFRWLWRQRIRLHLDGTGINPTPVDLHEQQMSLEQHSQAHRITTMDSRLRTGNPYESFSKPNLLPIRSLNEIFIGESLSSRYLSDERLTLINPQTMHRHPASLQNSPVQSLSTTGWNLCGRRAVEKQKSSGLSICTGTGSKAWSYNINKLAEQAVEEVLNIGKSQTGLDIPLNRDFIEKVTDLYNESLVFSPDDRRMVSVRSRCWDACMVVDGGTSFEFNDGAIATISLSEEDQLRTVDLEN
ncbi:hypothetical protein F7725_015070 [Dissostichus mawsoni]|uniref:NAD kinase 2, mitochondrial n=1 Tax=Dissostichus mawsoni TaxID=36200 RepID=A0A7J5YHE2_DISMA|nr:hypothetical protein F7725_015070 [Dissostichus mawsoni]